MNIFSIIVDLEDNDELHLSRILILLLAFSEKNGNSIEGLTKLAKLDFLLRYPVYFETALSFRNKAIQKLKIQDYERDNVESSMVRYRFGPWDFRYKRFLNLLAARGLLFFNKKGKTIEISITEKGTTIAKKLSSTPEFKETFDRAKMLHTHFNIAGTNLMRFIYDTFPQIGDMKYGEEITV